MSARRFDHPAVIVGGGPAGLSAAIALCRRAPSLARRIVVLERALYPRDKPCAGGVGRRGERVLARLGALPDVAGEVVRGIAFTCDRGAAHARAAEPIGRVVRRVEYDHALARLASGLGVRVLDGTTVEAVEHLDEGGARVRTSRGDLHARVVVGADGVGSVVRRAMGLSRGILRAQVLELDTEPLPTDRARDLLHFDATDRSFPGYFWDFPTRAGGEALVCRGIYCLKVEGEDHDLQGLLGARLSRQGLDLGRHAPKRFAERGYVRRERVADGALLLAGEAAGVDPVSGEGIAQAIEHGAAAGRFTADVLTRGLAVSDWQVVTRGSRLGLDLSLRARLVAPFYGSEREAMERFMLRHPEVIRLGCEHFGGLPYGKADLARVLLAGGLRFGRALVAHRGGDLPRGCRAPLSVEA